MKHLVPHCVVRTCMQTSHCDIVTEEILYSELFSVTCVWLVDIANALGRHKGMSAWADGSGFQKSASGGQWLVVWVPSLSARFVFLET